MSKYLIVPGIGERIRQAYERGYTPNGCPMPPRYPIPARYHYDLDESMHDMVLAYILCRADCIFYS